MSEQIIYTPQEAREKLFAKHIPEYMWRKFLELDETSESGCHVVRALILIAQGTEPRDFNELYETLSGTLNRDELGWELRERIPAGDIRTRLG